MQSHLRLANIRAARAIALPQRRLLATPSGPVIPPTPPSGAVPIRPVVVTAVPITPGSSTLPPNPPLTADAPPLPPPPPPRKPRRLFRRALIYTSLGLLIIYPLSGWLSTQNETYREFFVGTFPGGEALADYADENGWESFGYGTVQKKAVEGWQTVTGGAQTAEKTTAEKAKLKADELRQRGEATTRKVSAETEKAAEKAKAKVENFGADTESKAKEVAAAAQKKAEETKAAAQKAIASGEAKAKELSAQAKKQAEEGKERAASALTAAADKARELASDAKAKISEASSSVPFNFSEGIEGIVREAEKALGKGEAKVEHAVDRAKDAFTGTSADGTRVLPDTQRPRQLRPETVSPRKPTFEGKEKYSGPPLPLGFEPPPGYYIAPPPKAAAATPESKPTLPLLVPKVKEFASEEPIISQLASTIDSLTASLASPSSNLPNDATGILSKAQDDLTALSSRLSEVKKLEKEKLEKSLASKTSEFEAILRNREAERAQTEAGLRGEWQKERQGMVDEWKKSMDKELESQREGIEKRLHEEVVSQGIELQRRWLRSIKSQVETERGGRLAKLDHLTTSLKQLERITLDNSATLDDNVRLHKVWTALRAVQAKTDSGDLAFDDELRVLKSIASPSTPEAQQHTKNTVISATLNQLETSGIAQTGVKSLASLSSWFTNSVAPRVQSASLVPAPEQATVLSHLASRALSGIMFRPKGGLVEGNDVGAILARAEWCLGEKDLDGAAREVNRLTGWPGRLAADWLREARRTLEVKQALEIVGTEATLASLLLV